MRTESKHHVGIGRDFVIAMIQENGAKRMLIDWKGTNEEAIRELKKSPEIITNGCDNQNKRGECQGHSKAVKE